MSRGKDAPEVSILNVDELLEAASRSLLLDGGEEVLFPIRRRASIVDFYENLEAELRQQTLISVAEYRVVKEGWAKLSRPSVLRVRREDLFRHLPHLAALESELRDMRQRFAMVSADQVFRKAYRDIVAAPDLARACFEVMDYLLSHRDEIKGLLPRQVQHSNSTKLIGREGLLLKIFGIWRGDLASWDDFFRYFGLVDKPVEFRFFAPECFYQGARLREFHGLLAAEWAENYTFGTLDGTLIVENLETFYAESAREQRKLIIWGGGWKVMVLRSFQSSLPRPIRYWGDVDKEGYEIYGLFRNFVPDLKSVLMDHETIRRHLCFATRKEPFFGPFRFVAEVQDAYQMVCREGICIEQEKIRG